VDFLQLVVAGKIDEAYEIYVDMIGKHHNVYYAADFGALKQGMIENHSQFLNKQLKVKNVLADGDLVAVHSSIVMKPVEMGISVVHIFRFNQCRIVEMWDIDQAILADSLNLAGAF
jgi:predicted SnoaL-like aldol condensation-catalyzing enzyme